MILDLPLGRFVLEVSFWVNIGKLVLCVWNVKIQLLTPSVILRCHLPLGRFVLEVSFWVNIGKLVL
jgi:hypothetical protein